MQPFPLVRRLMFEDRRNQGTPRARCFPERPEDTAMDRVPELLNRPAVAVPGMLALLVGIIELAKSGAAS